MPILIRLDYMRTLVNNNITWKGTRDIITSYPTKRERERRKGERRKERE